MSLKRVFKLPTKHTANATQLESQLKQCDICSSKGAPLCNFPLRRPDCCKPIYVCSHGHSKREILETFRHHCWECPKHSQATIPEVEFIHAQH